MKRRMFSLLLLVGMVLFMACPSHPQNVSIKTTYSTNVTADSTYLIYWSGTSTAGCPLIEDNEITSVNLSDPSISVYKIPIGNNQEFIISKPTNGRTFRVAIVNWLDNLQNVPIPSKMTVSAFYVLPFDVQKATIINVEIN